MTKADIVNKIAKNTGLEKTEVQSVVEGFMECVIESLSKDEAVYLRGFGSFIIKHRAEKTARDITKKTTIVIPAHDIPAFKPADSFMEKVSK
ncbi:MAG: integration host factor subunit beta [Bacteroidales bacterium]|jgi:DNA-binding protein HU-beta|nr:integration host factor subunit beta [Bacteroidales bacterium]